MRTSYESSCTEIDISIENKLYFNNTEGKKNPA